MHARGTRWGVIQETLPADFTHWAKLSWLDYNMPCDRNPVVVEQYLEVGSIAVVQTDNAQPVVVSSVEYRADKTHETIGRFADGALLTVIAVTNDMCRLVEGVGTKGEYLKGYARLINLRDSNAV
ncbi:hypothetical protein FACS1894184_04950 [Clostridia bacterium]|nr:hypothetical protein FACS1894184_04950 [Clostridia bacterium]